MVAVLSTCAALGFGKATQGFEVWLWCSCNIVTTSCIQLSSSLPGKVFFLVACKHWIWSYGELVVSALIKERASKAMVAGESLRFQVPRESLWILLPDYISFKSLTPWLFLNSSFLKKGTKEWYTVSPYFQNVQTSGLRTVVTVSEYMYMLFCIYPVPSCTPLYIY